MGVEKMVGVGDPVEGDGLGAGGDGFDFGVGGEAVMVADEEEFGLRGVGEIAVVILAGRAFFLRDGDRQAEADEGGDMDGGLGETGGFEGDGGPERKSGGEDGQAEIAMEPGEGGEGIFTFARAAVIGAFAETDSAKVDAEDGQVEGVEGLHGVVDDFVVHRPAAGGMGMAEQDGERGGGRAGVEQGFDAAGGALEVGDGTEGGHWVQV